MTIKAAATKTMPDNKFSFAVNNMLISNQDESFSFVKWVTNHLIQVGATIRYNKLCTPNFCLLITLTHSFSAVRALPARNKLNCEGYLDRSNLDYLRQTQNLVPPPQHLFLFICRHRLATIEIWQRE